LAKVDESGLADAMGPVLAGRAAVAVVAANAEPRVIGRLPQAVDGPGVVVWTSGSTGDPKAVWLRREAVLAAVEACHERLGGPGRWVCPLPLHNVAGLMTLARGLSAQGWRRCDPKLRQLEGPVGRSHISLVPAQLHSALADSRIARALAGFATVLLGGQGAPAALLDEAKRAGINVVTTYGMSETCGGCVYDGLPLNGVAVDFEAGGRVVLDTPTAFSGYLGEPELTAETLDGHRVRTRDRGVWENGRLRVLGRLDDVVVSGGVNVDLAGLQARCDELWGVDEANRVVVFGIPDQRWGTSVVATTRRAATLDEIREALGPTCGPAALPKQLRRAVGPRPALAGKIRRGALAAQWQKGDDGDTSGVD
jgi:O-succinylbenzoic acid--CoA ligase